MSDMEMKRNLYICDQTFEFFNIINLQLTLNKDVPAEILFSDKNDFKGVIEKVKSLSLFDAIYEIEVKEFELEFHKKTKEEQIEIVLNPRDNLEFPNFENAYTDVWINIDNIHAKLEYYNLIKMGMTPKIHLIQEGIGNFTRTNAIGVVEKEWEKHYGEYAYSKNVVDNYLYRTEAFCGNGIEIKEIPTIDVNDNEIKDVFYKIYGKHELPDEKFIFMETSLYDMGIMSNEVEVFETLAKFVGKENIIVKRHPRNTIDRFTPLGYKVMEEESVPWEVLLLQNHDRVKNKVVCSLFSQTIFSPYDIFNISMKSFILWKLLRHYVFWYQKKEWKEYAKLTVDSINYEITDIYIPEDYEELQEMIRFCKTLDGGKL